MVDCSTIRKDGWGKFCTNVWKDEPKKNKKGDRGLVGVQNKTCLVEIFPNGACVCERERERGMGSGAERAAADGTISVLL